MFALALLAAACGGSPEPPQAGQSIGFDEVTASIGSRAGSLLGAGGVTPDVGVQSGNTGTTRFASSAEVLRQVDETIATAMAGTLRSGTSCDDLSKLLSGGELQRGFSRAIGHYGFSTSDLADVLTGVVMLGWQVANDVPALDEAEGYRRIRAGWSRRWWRPAGFGNLAIPGSRRWPRH